MSTAQLGIDGASRAYAADRTQASTPGREPSDVEAHKQLDLGLTARWGLRDSELRFPWWRKPAKVKVLLYADGTVHFDGGSFLGLQYVHKLLSHAMWRPAAGPVSGQRDPGRLPCLG